MDPNKDEGYIRRPDRSMESNESSLARMSEQDRQKIYGLRKAVTSKLDRIQNLEDSVAEKDLLIDHERELRKSLEEKILQHHLVDMYGDPSVNDELNDRLPRTKDKALGRSRHHKRKNKKKKRISYSQSEESSDGSETTAKHGPHNATYPGASFFNPFPFVTNHGYMNPMYHSHTLPHSTPVAMPPGGAGLFIPQSTNPNMGGPAVDSQFNSPIKKAGETQRDFTTMQSFGALSSDGKERQISRLLTEIDLLKERNKKLETELLEVTGERDRYKTENELIQATDKEETSARVSKLIQEVYDKQKQRDHAVMARLKLANEERDHAMQMIKVLKQGLTLEGAVADETLDPSATADAALSSLEIHRDRSAIIQAVHGATDYSKDLTYKQLNELRQEKENAELKVQRLEKELLSAQRDMDNMIGLKDQSEKLKYQLINTQHERDSALSKLVGVMEENGQLKIYYSLHQSLSKEQSWRDQYNNSLDQMQQMLTQREGHVIDAQKETNKLQATIQQLTDERETLRMELEKIQACDSDRQLVNERLQRHVTVLQKKLKRMSVSPPAV